MKRSRRGNENRRSVEGTRRQVRGKRGGERKQKQEQRRK